MGRLSNGINHHCHREKERLIDSDMNLIIFKSNAMTATVEFKMPLKMTAIPGMASQVNGHFGRTSTQAMFHPESKRLAGGRKVQEQSSRIPHMHKVRLSSTEKSGSQCINSLSHRWDLSVKRSNTRGNYYKTLSLPEGEC